MRSLHFTTGSPFARGVRILLDELGLDYERHEEITTPTVEERARNTPTLQVPTFRDGKVVLWESGLISEYLLATHDHRPAGDPPLTACAWRPECIWDDKLTFATIQTLGTAVTTISQMTWSGIRHDANDYLTRSAERPPHLLQWLEARISIEGAGFLPDCLSIQDIFLTCHLRFVENRPLGLDPQMSRWPRIAALLERLETRPSFRANPILWWEPGVVGYAQDGVTPVYAD